MALLDRPLRGLTLDEIKKLASLPNVKRIAVENFLMTVECNKTALAAHLNLEYDANLYKWNMATINAIARGIELASREEGQ